VDSNRGVSKALRGNPNAYIKEKMGTNNPVPKLDYRLPAASPGGKEGQEPQMQSFSGIENDHIANIHRMDDKQLFPHQTQSVIQKASQKQSVVGNTCIIPNLPTRASEAVPEPVDKTLSSRNTVQKPWVERTYRGKSSLSTNSRETFKVEELCGLQPRPSMLTSRDRGKFPESTQKVPWPLKSPQGEHQFLTILT
jgi:hypothetical protein